MHGCSEETITIMTQGGRWIAAMQSGTCKEREARLEGRHTSDGGLLQGEGVFWDSRQGLRFLQKKGTRDEARLTDDDKR
jgi:hypothetical protein